MNVSGQTWPVHMSFCLELRHAHWQPWQHRVYRLCRGLGESCGSGTIPVTIPTVDVQKYVVNDVLKFYVQ